MSVSGLSELNPRAMSEMSNEQLVQVAQEISQAINPEVIQRIHEIMRTLLAREDGKDAGLVVYSMIKDGKDDGLVDSMIHDVLENSRMMIASSSLSTLGVFFLSCPPGPMREDMLLKMLDRYCIEEDLAEAVDFAQKIFPEKSRQEILDFVAQRCFETKCIDDFVFVALSDMGAKVSDEVWGWLAEQHIPNELHSARFFAAKIENVDQFSLCFQKIAQSYLTQGMLVEAHSVTWQIPDAEIVKDLLKQQIPELQNQPEALERIASKNSAFFTDFCRTIARRAMEAREYKKAVSIALNIFEVERRNAILVEIVQAVRNNPEQLHDIINQMGNLAMDICSMIVVQDVKEERWERAVGLIEIFGDRKSRTAMRIPFARELRQNPARIESLDPALRDKITLQLVKTDMEQGQMKQAVIEACRMQSPTDRNYFLFEILLNADIKDLRPIFDQMGTPLFTEICHLIVQKVISDQSGLARAWEVASLIPVARERDALFSQIIQMIRNSRQYLRLMEPYICDAVEVEIAEQNWEAAADMAQYILDQSQRNFFFVQIGQGVQNDPVQLRAILGKVGMPLGV